MAGVWLLGCRSPEPEDTSEPDPPQPVVVDLTDAQAIVVMRGNTREILGRRARVYKDVGGGDLEELFPHDWQILGYSVGGGQMAVFFDQRHWFPSADGTTGLMCKVISFSVSEPTEAPVYCLLPLEGYAPGACDELPDPNSWACSEEPRVLETGSDGVTWLINQLPDNRYHLYAYHGGFATHATPAGLLEALDEWIFPVEGGALLPMEDGVESYWLNEEGTADVALLWAPGGGYLIIERGWIGDGAAAAIYAGYHLVYAFDGGPMVIDLSVPELRPLGDVVTFDVAPTYELRFDAMYGDDLYVSYYDLAEDRPYRCTPDLACTSIPGTDPVWSTLHRATERMSDGDVSYAYIYETGGHHFLHEQVVSDDIGAEMYVIDVRLIEGKLHVEGVNADNVAGVFRVDFVDDEFVFTEVSEASSQVVETIPLTFGE